MYFGSIFLQGRSLFFFLVISLARVIGWMLIADTAISNTEVITLKRIDRPNLFLNKRFKFNIIPPR